MITEYKPGVHILDEKIFPLLPEAMIIKILQNEAGKDIY
jgi:hypothetical protein